ncbi:MAG: hypothetical protein EOP53_04585 [Sphingobacteriales bacterium]|nr:MAG: hypothetical protein EOP53_04585 [Sphingobacteriales bacterium]
MRTKFLTGEKISFASIFAILLICSSVKAQMVSYSVVQNDPHDLKKLEVYFSPFYAEIFSPSITLGYGIGANYQLNNKIDLMLFFNKPYAVGTDEAYRTNKVFIPTHNNLETPMHKTYFLEAGGALELSDNDKQKNVKIVLSSSSSYSRYIMVPGTVRKINKLRGGVFNYNSIISTDLLGDDFKLQAKDEKGGTVTFTTYDLLQPDGSETFPYDGLLDWAVNMNVTSFYAGLSRESITKMIVKPEDYRKNKSKQFNSNFYADVMFAPLITMGDIKFHGKTYDVTNGDENSFRKNNFGWRVGYEFNFLNKVAYGAKMELGVRPGLKSKGFFFNLVYRFPIIRFMEDKG